MLEVSLYSTPSSCSGDEDSVIPLIGTAQTVNKVAKDLRLIPTSPYRVWFQGQQVKAVRNCDEVQSFLAVIKLNTCKGDRLYGKESAIHELKTQET
jgi:hypothetical protein